MKLSIVTVCLDSATTLVRTIDSVASQGYADVEHVVVDGGSKDGTVDILAREVSAGRIARFISEQDEGIADAFNKGIALSTGEVVAILNSDDYYLPEVVPRLMAMFEGSKLDFVLHGNMVRVSQRGAETIREYLRPRPLPRLWKFVDSPYDHPTVFVPRRVYDRVGVFDKSYRYAMDYDWYLRALAMGVRFRYSGIDTTVFSGAGKSGSDPAGCHKEVLRSQIAHGLSRPVCFASYAAKMTVRSLKRWTARP
jgi:glycosyltransferase involved in cell wall biosynthesis